MTDPDVEALRRLCGEGTEARQRVADAIGANEQTIYQILTGVKLPSGNPKGIGPKLRQRLDIAFPGWRGQPVTLSAQATATATATADLEVGKPLTLERALPVVLARLPGLDRYTAAKVQGAIEAALQPGAPLERIERDLVQWLSEPAPKASEQVLSAKPSFETADIVKPRAERMP